MLGAPGGPSLGERTLGYCLACFGPPPDSGTLWWWPATLPRELSAPSLWPWATCWLAFLVPLTDSTSWSSRPEEGAFTTRLILPTGTETHSPTCNRLPEEAGVCVCVCMYTGAVCQPGAGPAGAAIYKQRRLRLSSNQQRQADNTFPLPPHWEADRKGQCGGCV